MRNAYILIVEDDKRLARLVELYLKDFGYTEVVIVPSGLDAVNAAKQNKPALVIMDIILEGTMDGIQAAKEIRELHDNVPVIYLTGLSDDAKLDELKRTEPYGYILKPPDPGLLKIMIEVAIYKNNIESKLKESEMWFHSALRSISDGIIVADKAGCVKFVNPVVHFLDNDETANNPCSDIKDLFKNSSASLANDVVGLISQVVKNAAFIKKDILYTVNTKKRGEVELMIEAAPIIDEKENLIGVIIFLKETI